MPRRLPKEEAVLLAAIAGGEGSSFQPALECFLEALLAGIPELGPRSTDGVEILREEKDALGHAVIGMAWMIADQSREPFFVELRFGEGPSLVRSGRASFGVSKGSRLPSGVNSRGKLSAVLQAYSRDAVAGIAWAHRHGMGQGAVALRWDARSASTHRPPHGSGDRPLLKVRKGCIQAR